MAFTVNGFANPQEHVKALRAQGMTASAARLAERKAFFAAVIERQRANGRTGNFFDEWLTSIGTTREQFNAMPAPKAWEGPIGKAARGRAK